MLKGQSNHTIKIKRYDYEYYDIIHAGERGSYYIDQW